jgi:cysteine desulfurase/selenocysteine lyase
VLMGEEDVVLYGPKSADNRGGVIAFNLGDIHPHDLGTLLDREGVAIRAGHHCCQPLMRRLGQAATARASFYIYNTCDEVDSLVSALGSARAVFG